jgi:hypothetical protein
MPDEIDPLGFEANLDGCSDKLREMVAYVCNTAKHSGADVTTRRYKHPKPNTGWGITYYTGGEKFCEVHPKSTENHVWVFLHGADRATLVAEGFESSEQNGWFKVRTMREAVRFAKWILAAHDARG